jgi:hypothetical protein
MRQCLCHRDAHHTFLALLPDKTEGEIHGDLADALDFPQGRVTWLLVQHSLQQTTPYTWRSATKRAHGLDFYLIRSHAVVFTQAGTNASPLALALAGFLPCCLIAGVQCRKAPENRRRDRSKFGKWHGSMEDKELSYILTTQPVTILKL